MNTRNEKGIVVDSFGNVDIAYYEAKAQQMRMETVAKGVSAARVWIERQALKAVRAVKVGVKGYSSREA